MTGTTAWERVHGYQSYQWTQYLATVGAFTYSRSRTSDPEWVAEMHRQLDQQGVVLEGDPFEYGRSAYEEPLMRQKVKPKPTAPEWLGLPEGL